MCTAGLDDAKVSIPATVVLRYMFTSAEMRVSSEPPVVCRISPKWLLFGTCCNICDHACPALVQTLAVEAAFTNQKNGQIEKANSTLIDLF